MDRESSPTPRAAWRRRVLLRLLILGAPTLLILYGLWTTGLRRGRVREVKAWEEHVTQLRAEAGIRPTPTEEERRNRGVSTPPASSQPSLAIAGVDSKRYAEALALVETMYDFWQEKMVHHASVKSFPGRENLDLALGDIEYEFEGKESVLERIPILLKLNQPNLDRLKVLGTYADVWPAIEKWAVEAKQHDEWFMFKAYLLHLSFVPLRPLWKKGDTAAFAEAFVRTLPLFDMLAEVEEDYYYREWNNPSQVMQRYLERTLRAVSFKKSDWERLDWSPLMKHSRPVSREEMALQFDNHIAEVQSDLADSMASFSKRREYCWVRGFDVQSTFRSVWRPAYVFVRMGSAYDKVTAVRERGFEMIMNGATLKDMASLEKFGLETDRRILGDEFVYVHPAYFAEEIFRVDRLWLIDLALRLIRGDSLRAIATDGKSPFPALLADFGADVEIDDVNPDFHQSFNIISGRTIDGFAGVYRGAISVLSFRFAGPLPQLEGKAKVVLTDLIKPKETRP